MITINDPAGTAIEFTKAINRYTDHSCRLITKEIRYNFMFEKDLHLPWLDAHGWEEVEELLRTSDVFHFHMTADEYIEVGPFKPVDYMRNKMIVHHHHGHPDFRSHPGNYREKYKARGRHNLLVSTPDLLHLLPEARWQPNLVPIDDPLYTPLENKPDAPVIICHSPTRRELKNTDDLVHAVNHLKKRTATPIELCLVQNTPHTECLRLKRQSHILFDHIQGYFGVSSLEGLSQGLCVVCGLDAWCAHHISLWTGTDQHPWIVTDASRLSDCLMHVVDDADYRLAIGEKSRQYMQTCWNDRKVVRRLVDFYGR